MVKDCNVLLNNADVTVIDFEGVEVQLPSIHRDTRKVRILFKDGKYIAVNDDFVEKEEKAINFDKTTKKEGKKFKRQH